MLGKGVAKWGSTSRAGESYKCVCWGVATRATKQIGSAGFGTQWNRSQRMRDKSKWPLSLQLGFLGLKHC